MKQLSLVWLGALLVLMSCAKSTEPDESAQETESSGNPLTAPVDYLGAVGAAKKSAVRTVDLASLNRTIQMFYASEDRFPKDLKELVSTGYLPQMPAPPQGTRFVYDPARGQLGIVRLPPEIPQQ